MFKITPLAELVDAVGLKLIFNEIQVQILCGVLKVIFLFIFFPMVNACCVWVFEMVLGKIYTILIVAHFYILFFIFGF